MHPWFMLKIPSVIISLIFLIPTIIAAFKGYFNYKGHKIAIICTCLMFLWIAKDANFYGIIEAIINIIIISSLICLKPSPLLDTLNSIIKWLSVILIISIIFYILFLVGINLPHSTLDVTTATRTITFDNYYVFIQQYEIFGLTRFYSIFLEPGYLTLGIAPLLYIKRYNLKDRSTLILFVAQLLSFSLAGYIVLICGFVYTIFCGKERLKLKKSVISITILTLSLLSAYNFLGEDYFEQTIFRRIQFVNGTLSGDDRSSNYLDYEYEKLISSDDKWTGTYFDVNKSEKGVAGFKLFTVENGIIGVFLVIILYLSLISFRIRFNYSTGLIILLLLLLYQNAYPWASCVLYPAICARYAFKKEYAEYVAK